jgi:hypothetical protein
MELSVDSDIYSPNIDDNGNYTDYLPSTNKFTHGLRCPCGTRKDHVFDSRPSFAIHIKTKTHQKWMVELNANKMNFYLECEKLKDVVNSQKIIIAKLEKEIHAKLNTIDYLTQQIMTKDSNNVVVDLLSFD